MMVSVWMRARRELRARWRAWVSIALMVGVAGGVVMAAAAGARRSDSAVGRFLAYTKAPTADVEADPSDFPAIAALPEVDSAQAAAFMLMGESSPEPSGVRFRLNTVAFSDPHLIGTGEAIVTKGRLPDLSDPAQAIVNETALRQGLKIGDRIQLRGFTFRQLEDVLRGSNQQPKGPSATVTIVGALRIATDLSTTNPPRDVIYTSSSTLILTPALYNKIKDRVANFLGMSVRLKHGEADLPAFEADVKRMTKGQGIVHPGSDDVQAGVEAQRATTTEAEALWLFALLAAAAALVVIGQSISRQIFLGAGDNATLRALGMARGQLVTVAMIQVASAAILGTAIAVSVAILLSPLAPIGLAREAEVDLGFHLDSTVLLIGAASWLLLLAVRALLPAWVASRTGGETEVKRRPSRTADAFARASMPPSSVAGVQMALDPGHGRAAVPVRTAIGGSVVAIAVLIAALAFGASLSRLSDEPRLQGWNWDFAVGNPHSDDVSARAIPLLRKNPYVGSFSAETFGGVVLDGREEILALGLETTSGDVSPPLLEGREPYAPDEIALGSKSLGALKKHIGETVEVYGHDRKVVRSMRVVGRALINPVIVNGQITLGDGALMQLDTLKALVPAGATQEGAVNVFLVKLTPGVDRAAAKASLQHDFPGTVLTAYAPAEVENLKRIDTLPFILAGLLGLLAIATIAHALVTSVRRRRRDLAVLKTLGFVRAQVFATVAWQASTFAMVAAAIGLGVGVAGGRWLWIFFSNRLGIRPEPAIPILLLVVIVPAALAFANVIAALPARAAARTQPALVLRTE